MVSSDTWYDTDGDPHTAYVSAGEPAGACKCGHGRSWHGPPQEPGRCYNTWPSIRTKSGEILCRCQMYRPKDCCDAPAWMRALEGHQQGHRTPPDEGLFDPPRRRADGLWGRRRAE